MKLLTTSVVRGSHQGESHGGVYLIDLDRPDDPPGHRLEHGEHRLARPRAGTAAFAVSRSTAKVVYIAASDELFAFTPQFQRLGSWRNPYLRHCHEIAV